MAFLEDYTLLEELGQGAFATVYKVRHNKLGYIRAVRVLNKVISQGESDPSYQKFLEECILLLRLGNGNHPNIVHIYQPLLKDQHAVVEMDYVDGQDLYSYMDSHGSFVEIDEVMSLLKDIGGALAYCHEDIYEYCMDRDVDHLQTDPNDGSKVLIDDATKHRLIEKYQVVHNDLHPGNIMRKRNGGYILLDFGLAIEGNTVVRSSRKKNGVPEYKSPEKWRNESHISTQSDLYSFGVILYTMLAGRPPFMIDSQTQNSFEAEHQLYNAHINERPPAIYTYRKEAFEKAHPGQTYEKDYPDWLETLILKCLEKKEEDRFQSGRALMAFVEENEERWKTTAPGGTVAEEEETHKKKTVDRSQSGKLVVESEKTRHSPQPPVSSSSDDNVVKTLIVIIFVLSFFSFPFLLSTCDGCTTHGGDAVDSVDTAVVDTLADYNTVAKENVHDYVDLGLSVKWATCNVGADSPEDYGDYFAWGETEPKSTYDWNTYKWCQGSETTMTKYCTDSYGTVDKTQLDLSDDAAHMNWGGSWRMPTDDELTELREKCSWTWTIQNGVKGYKVTSKTNGNSIFLPAAGCRYVSSLFRAGSDGYYWSSSLGTGYPGSARFVLFDSGGVDWLNANRNLGPSVRPVCP